MTTSEIKLKITVDENHLPHKIEWEAPDANEGSICKSMMLALWDEKENNTMRIDLWTKDMLVGEMKRFFLQSLGGMNETLRSATNDNEWFNEVETTLQVLAEKLKREEAEGKH